MQVFFVLFHNDLGDQFNFGIHVIWIYRKLKTIKADVLIGDSIMMGLPNVKFARPLP